MIRTTNLNDPEIIQLLQAGGIGVLRTDTLYGIVARADIERAVERVYDLKNRDGDKSPIVLVADASQLFDTPTMSERAMLDTVWPGKVSVVLHAQQAPAWLSRTNASVAYRLPQDSALQELLRQTGPLIAPSANTQGEPPARSITEAMQYFGDDVDFYVDGGEVQDLTPSQLLRIKNSGEVERLR